MSGALHILYTIQLSSLRLMFPNKRLIYRTHYKPVHGHNRADQCDLQHDAQEIRFSYLTGSQLT